MTTLSLIVVVNTLISFETGIWNLDLNGRSGTSFLTGGNEVPLVDTLAQGGELSNFNLGNAGLQYDADDNLLSVQLDFGAFEIGYAGDLEGDFSGAHIHGPGDINTGGAGILHDLQPFTVLKTGDRSGVISGLVTLTDAQEDMLFGNLLYINIHSLAHPSGEIRANIVPVPEPAAYGLVGGLALLAFAGYRRWKAAQAQPGI